MQTLKEVLADLGAKSVCVAMDMDKPGWEASRRLVATLAEGGYGIGLATWDEAHKGLDDAVVAGAEVKILTLDPMCDYLEAKCMPPPPPPKLAPPTHPGGGLLDTLYTGVEILEGEFPAPTWVVPDVFPTGLAIFAGKSKIGKSYLVLDMAVSVATGTGFLDGRVLPEGKVIYLAYEDGPRRIHDRIGTILAGREVYRDKVSTNLKIAPSNRPVPRMTGSRNPKTCGAAWLKQALAENPDVKLVIIDTLEKFRPHDPSGTKHGYAGDYDVIGELKTLADECGVCVLIVHHVRKNTRDAEDIFDQILGSTGLLGAADTMVVLTRDRGKETGKLAAAGRDVQHVEYTVEFDDSLGRWVKTEKKEEDDKEVKHPKPGTVYASAVAWLRNRLQPGAVYLSADLQEEAKLEGISVKALSEARGYLGNVEVKREQGHWTWKLLLPKVASDPEVTLTTGDAR